MNRSTITCTTCGKTLTEFELKLGHACYIKASLTVDDITVAREYTEERKHSVIVDGMEYWVNSNKLTILEQLIKL